MKIKKFLDKKTNKKTKIAILEKMLKEKIDDKLKGSITMHEALIENNKNERQKL